MPKRRRKRPPQSLRKFFRREKARIRREAPDESRAEERIRELIVKYWPQPGRQPVTKIKTNNQNAFQNPSPVRLSL